MTIKYLLDTNILSEAKRPQPNQKVMENLHLSKQEISTIAVTNNLILVTNNVNDFINFDGLIIENWFEK